MMVPTKSPAATANRSPPPPFFSYVFFESEEQRRDSETNSLGVTDPFFFRGGTTAPAWVGTVKTPPTLASHRFPSFLFLALPEVRGDLGTATAASFPPLPSAGRRLQVSRAGPPSIFPKFLLLSGQLKMLNKAFNQCVNTLPPPFSPAFEASRHEQQFSSPRLGPVSPFSP